MVAWKETKVFVASLLGLIVSFTSPWALAQIPESGQIHARITRAERFLTNLFDPTIDLLPEYRGARVYWLFHDNYLAAKVLDGVQPTMAARIRESFNRFAVSHSGKIEIVFDEAKGGFPFRNYELLTVTNLGEKIVRTERVTQTVLKGWTEYADLLLLASMTHSRSDPEAARKFYAQALMTWDNNGFNDQATKGHKLYATYKLALGLLAADRLKQDLPFRSRLLKTLVSMQSSEGGFVTDYDREGKPQGLANVETTCLTILALKTIR